MQKRGRLEEGQVGLDYLQKIHTLHEEWLGNGFILDGTTEFEQDETQLNRLLG